MKGCCNAYFGAETGQYDKVAWYNTVMRYQAGGGNGNDDRIRQ